MSETVLTSRRAVLLGAPPVQGRLRLSDRALRFEPSEGAAVELEVAAIRRIALRHRVLVVSTRCTEVRLRCFGVRGVGGLLVQARTG